MKEEELIVAHEHLARRQALAFCHKKKLTHEADEFQSIALTGLVKAARLWKPELGAKFSTFAYLTIGHSMLQELRRRNRREALAERGSADLPAALGVEVFRVLDAPEEEPVVDMSYAGQATAEELVDREAMRALVDSLPEQHRELVRLRYLEDRPAVEVCERLGVHKATARRLELDALDILRERLETGVPRGTLPELPKGEQPRRDMSELRISRSDLLKLKERLEAEHRQRIAQIDAALSLFDSGLLGPVVASAPVAAPRAKPQTPPQTRMQMGALREIAEQAAAEMPEKFTLTDFYAACERISGSSLSRASVSCQLQRLTDRGSFVQQQKGSRGRPSIFRRASEALAA